MIRIGARKVGGGSPCLVIAELGTSHLGDPALAKELVDAAADAGADCIKTQLVHADEILHPLSGPVDLPTGRVELYEHFKSLERDASFYEEVKSYVERRGVLFLCSVFGLRGARELKAMNVIALKIASPELNHFPLLREVAGYGVPLVLSSGVSTLGDIERALDVTGRNTVLLHCVTSYPAPEEDYNLKVLLNLRGIFGVEVGVSDHSLDAILVPALAVLLGACVVEKHFTLSKSGTGLDDPVALEPPDFRRMVRWIREIEGADRRDARTALGRVMGEERLRRIEGDGVKRLSESEKANYRRTNRSIHAVHEIPAGTVIRDGMVAVLRTEKVLRPGVGPEFLPNVLGARTIREVAAGQGIVWEDLLAT